MDYEYITIAAIPAPQGAVVIEWGGKDDMWCYVMPCHGIAVQAQFSTEDLGGMSLIKKRTSNERAVPIYEDVDEWGLAPAHIMLSNIMLVTPITSARDIQHRISEGKGFSDEDAQKLYVIVAHALGRVGIQPK